MITRLYASGFKNLWEFELRLGPFTCIAGQNAVGKSNIFDVIRFLNLLAQHPLMEAAQLLREAGERSTDPRSLFTAFGGFRSERMTLEVDLLIPRTVVDDLGVESEASISSVRYSLELVVSTEGRADRLEIAREELVPIPLSEHRESLGFSSSADFRKTAVSGRRTVPLISTITSPGGIEIRAHQEGHGARVVPAARSSRTVMSGLASSDFPTLLATQREMLSWRTLLLEPSAMRASSQYRDPKSIDLRGANLPAAIERLRTQPDMPIDVPTEIANRLSRLIDDVQEIRITDDERTETLILEVRGADGVFHSAPSLSDGTLRFLVLAVLSVDPEATGVICLEEPENGIHPARVHSMVELLREIAVDPHFSIGNDNPLRQVLINTHSPGVVQQVDPSEIVFLESVRTAFDDTAMGDIAFSRAAAGSWRARLDADRATIARGQIVPYFRPLGDTSKEPQQTLLDLGELEWPLQ